MLVAPRRGGILFVLAHSEAENADRVFLSRLGLWAGPLWPALRRGRSDNATRGKRHCAPRGMRGTDLRPAGRLARPGKHITAFMLCLSNSGLFHVWLFCVGRAGRARQGSADPAPPQQAEIGAGAAARSVASCCRSVTSCCRRGC